MKKGQISDEVYSNLPDFIKNLVNGFSGREKDIVLVSSLAVMSNCMPNVYGVYDGKDNLPHIYLMIIAPPASGKGTMGYSLELIDKIHQKILSESQLQIAAWKKNKNSDRDSKPSIKVKLLPGNISSSKFYKYLSDSEYGLTIFETEADTLSSMLKQDWGDFSDILRKAFHNEKLSISRATDDYYLEIKHPKLSMVLSGTPGQVKPLIQSTENGLFSRFLFYYFNDIVKWKDVSPGKHDFNHKAIFKSAGDDIYTLYENLMTLMNKIEFKLSNNQWKKLNIDFGDTTDVFESNGLGTLKSSVFRIAPIQFRIAMILTVIRNRKDISKHKELICSDVDFRSSQLLIQHLLNHTLKVSELFEKEKNKLSVVEYSVLSELPKKFKRADAIKVSKTASIKARTMDNYLKKWCAKKVVRKLSTGYYEKVK